MNKVNNMYEEIRNFNSEMETIFKKEKILELKNIVSGIIQLMA